MGHKPLTAERAREVLANGRNGFGTGCNGVKDYRQLLVGDELLLVDRAWRDAPGSWSFNDVISDCAKVA